MFKGSRFCARCGAEATRELVDESTPLECPRCREAMQALRLGATDVRECAACGGLWLDPETLQRLSDARESHADVVSVLAARAPANAVGTEVIRYVPCPSCAKLMNRTNFAKSSGVVLDICKSHGVWLDRGELQRVLQFIDSGGLAQAREREQRQLVEERRRLEALRNYPVHQSGDVVIHTQLSARGDEPAAGVLAHVLSDASTLFTGRSNR
jgi:Zn-finger nucleic acid-binding protein